MPEAHLFDDELLADYAHRFFGYGNYQGAYWFVGIEEGGGTSFQEVADALASWDGRGRNELEDLGASQDPAGASRFFSHHAQLQPTWSKLIRVLLAAEGRDMDTEAVRLYQRMHLGRREGDTCLLELLPLPSPSSGKWMYNGHSRLPQLQTREIYFGYYAPRRAERIKQRIAEYRPKVVVLYGVSNPYQDWWGKIAGSGVDFTPTKIGQFGVSLGRTDFTVFAIASHPTRWGITNEYFDSIGRAIRTLQG